MMVVNRCFMGAWFELETVEDQLVPIEKSKCAAGISCSIKSALDSSLEQLAPVWQFSRSTHTFPGTAAAAAFT